MRDGTDPGRERPSDLWLAVLLLGAQALLYIVYRHLVHRWEFFAMVVPATGLLALVLWETRHWVRTRTTHVIHLLILADTLAEGILQAWARDEARRNLYCVAAFAVVIILHRLWLYGRGPASAAEQS